MPYQSNYLGDFWNSYRQRRATGGRPLTSQEMRGLLDPMLAYSSRREENAADRAVRQDYLNRQMNLAETAQKRQQSAATVSGLLQLPLTYGVAKQSGLLPGGFSLTSPSTWGGAANPGAAAAAGGGGAANIGGAFGTGGALAPPASPFTGVGPLAEFGGGSAAAGVGSAILPGVAGGAAGFGLSKVLGANEDISQGLTYGGAGAAAGFAIGGPVGAAVGGLIGAGISFLDDIF